MIRAALGLSIVMIVAAQAAADPATADKLAATATDLVAKGQFRAAAAKFAEAYKEDPSRPELFCNIGISYYKAQELPRAHLLVSQCLTRTALEQGFIDLARAVLKQVEDTLRASGHTPVTINVVPQETSVVIQELGEESKFLGPRTVWLSFGTYHVMSSADGHVTKRSEIVAADQKPLTVDIKLDRSEAVLPLPPLTPKIQEPTPSKVPAIIATGTTVAVIVIAIVAFGRAHEAANDAPLALDRATFDEDNNEASKWNTVMGVTGALAVVGAATSTYLWVKATRTTRVEVKPSTTGAALVFGGRF